MSDKYDDLAIEYTSDGPDWPRIARAFRWLDSKREAETCEWIGYIEHAKDLLTQAVSGQQTDPSWMRPMALTVAQINERIEQARLILCHIVEKENKDER